MWAELINMFREREKTHVPFLLGSVVNKTMHFVAPSISGKQV